MCQYCIVYFTTGNIFCLADSSCSQSVFKSSSQIFCLAPASCANSVILEAKFLYCTLGACTNAQINSVATVYLIDNQAGATVFSNGISYMNIYMRGAAAGGDVTITCNENDFCNIDCGDKTACSGSMLYCYGKCTMECNDTIGTTCPEVEVSVAPSLSPSMAPTAMPTDEPTFAMPAAFTEEDIEDVMQWSLITISIIVLILVAVGYGDAKRIRKNDLFQYTAIIAFGFYVNDFISDVFFSGKLLLQVANNSSDNVYLLLFCASIMFIIIPLFVNVGQLHNEIKHWRDNQNETVNSQACIWIKSRIKIIYIITFICGSSFSTISLCNSYLFQLNIFSMGLSKKQLAIFKNKRIFSVVLLEVKKYAEFHCVSAIGFLCLFA